MAALVIIHSWLPDHKGHWQRFSYRNCPNTPLINPETLKNINCSQLLIGKPGCGTIYWGACHKKCHHTRMILAPWGSDWTRSVGRNTNHRDRRVAKRRLPFPTVSYQWFGKWLRQRQRERGWWVIYLAMRRNRAAGRRPSWRGTRRRRGRWRGGTWRWRRRWRPRRYGNAAASWACWELWCSPAYLPTHRREGTHGHTRVHAHASTHTHKPAQDNSLVTGLY